MNADVFDFMQHTAEPEEEIRQPVEDNDEERRFYLEEAKGKTSQLHALGLPFLDYQLDCIDHHSWG